MLKKIKLPFKLNESLKRKLIIVLTLLCLVLFLFNYKQLFVAALVNNRPITRLAVIQEAEKQTGQQILETLVAKALVAQEAKKQGIEITKQQVDEEIKGIEEQLEAQGTDLDSLLEAQGQTRKGLEEEIKLQLIIEKIIGQNIEITDEELEQYFEDNKEFLGEDVVFEDIKDDLREQLRQEKIGNEVSAWLEDLKANANINYFLKF